ncbi:hypothetical protein EBQ90_06100 [bacterium]|nr:hypothetical protein [bacterium]
MAFILGLFFIGANLNASVLRTYQGVDQGKPCYLYIHEELRNDPHDSTLGDYQVEVSTSYQHAGQGLGQVTLHFSPQSEGKVLEWMSEAGNEFLRVLLTAPATSLQDPTAFRLKWLHFDHLHDATCKDLKKVSNL